MGENTTAFLRLLDGRFNLFWRLIMIQYHWILGEKLSKEEAKGLMNELCDPEDDEGFTPFMRKLNFKTLLMFFAGSVKKCKQLSKWFTFTAFLERMCKSDV